MKKRSQWYISAFLTCLMLIGAAFFVHPSGSIAAETVDELRDKITDHNDRITALEREIAEYEKQISQTGKEAKSLRSEIARLNAERQKLLREISLTENQIANVGLTIQEIGIAIVDKEESIVLNMEAIASSIRKINEKESLTTLEILLANESISAALQEVDTLEQFEKNIQGELQELRGLKRELEDKRNQNETKRRELESLKDRYSDQKKITEINKVEKDRLLTVTRSQEEKYREELAERKRLKEQFEAELLEFESKLKIAIDPNSIPDPGTKVLEWPLEKVTITQYFGNTDFSRSNPGIYNGNGHNGIDLRASRGTAIKAAASGIVEGTGNTDVQKGCYSYGKWVLIKHSNGLSTLYAHLDLIKVSKGQEVNTGDIIGYSGNTGYSTGPHLHFTVYASQGVKVERFSKSINCKNVDIPVAALNAYLNPLSYLGNI